jgi:hypothetical protein
MEKSVPGLLVNKTPPKLVLLLVALVFLTLTIDPLVA